MQTLKTNETYDLNTADSVWSAHTLFRLFYDCKFRSIIIVIVFYFYRSLEWLLL